MRFFFVILFCVFATSAAIAGEQFEVFGVHLDQEPKVIRSKLAEKFGKKWKCEDQPPDFDTQIYTCGGHGIYSSIVYYDYNVEWSSLIFDCAAYGGCGGDDALEQVRRLLEDRWNIKFEILKFKSPIFPYEEVKIFLHETPSTRLDLSKYNLKINHKKKNKNNPSFD